MTAPDWSPALYLRFADERTRPSRDLLAQVPLTAPRRLVDIGCGPGNSTALLVERFPQAEVQGFDTSPAMLHQARATVPRAAFFSADAAHWQPEPGTDLLFANAVLQWVPDHLALMEKWLAQLDDGAVLAVQMPDNLAEPTHVLMRSVAESGTWAEKLRHAPRMPLPAASHYFDALSRHAAHLDIWHTIYQHVLPDTAAIIEWVKSTGLKPFLDPLAPEERQSFLDQYATALAKAYPQRVDGKVLLRFPRLFIVATALGSRRKPGNSKA